MTEPRLLLVDDDPDLGFIVRVLARRAGYDLTHHPDAESAWAGLDAARPDLVLLDVKLTGASGLEFLRRLRASPAHARHAVALFGLPTLTRDVAAGWAAGADYHLSKDLVTRPADWKQRVDEILTHLRGRDSGPSLFIRDVALPDVRLESSAVLLRFPDHLSVEVRDAMYARAGVTGPLTVDESRGCLLRLIDQLGCLFGRAAVDASLEALRAGGPSAEVPPRPVTTE